MASGREPDMSKARRIQGGSGYGEGKEKKMLLVIRKETSHARLQTNQAEIPEMQE